MTEARLHLTSFSIFVSFCPLSCLSLSLPSPFRSPSFFPHSLSPFVCLYSCPSVCFISIYLSNCLSVYTYPTLYVSISLNTCLSICLSINPIDLPICPSVCLYISIPISLHLSSKKHLQKVP